MQGKRFFVVKTLQKMVGKSPNQDQRDIFRSLLTDFIDEGHELFLLANKIDWRYFEKSFTKHYSSTGQPSIPIRLMVGSLMKRIYNLSDERLCA